MVWLILARHRYVGLHSASGRPADGVGSTADHYGDGGSGRAALVPARDMGSLLQVALGDAPNRAAPPQWRAWAGSAAVEPERDGTRLPAESTAMRCEQAGLAHGPYRPCGNGGAPQLVATAQ